MLRVIVDKQIIVIALGIFTAVGILSKCMVNAILSRLLHAAGNMNKSPHPLMRLVRAKFEHACMVSEKVENVEVFVDKYLYGYRVFGIRFHSLRRLEKAASFLCIATGLLGAVLTYSIYGMNDLVLRTGVIGIGLGILVYVFHLTTDENYRMRMVRNYMVDYLQNVCLHRYEKARQKELDEKRTAEWDADEEVADDEYAEMEFGGAKHAEAESGEPEFDEDEFVEMDIRVRKAEPVRPNTRKKSSVPENSPVSEQYPVLDTNKREDRRDKVKAAVEMTEKEEPEGTEQKSVEREILIRQILEEFMA